MTKKEDSREELLLKRQLNVKTKLLGLWETVTTACVLFVIRFCG